ncbi:MAG TPA: transaldolase family protein, partial [Steroidobacteraceae bacterium]
RLLEHIDQARAVLEELAKLGVDIQAVTQQLEDEGVEKFNQPFDKLIQALQAKQAGAARTGGARAAPKQTQTQH